MRIPIYQVDAFCDRLFAGNPAAVCPLESWLPDERLQQIAQENNLSETAFFVPAGEAFEIRWLTPTTEVDLCGHATLATSFVIFNILHPDRQKLEFQSKSGPLVVERDDDLIVLDFPARPPVPHPEVDGLAEALGIHPTELHKAEDFLALLPSATAVAELTPDFAALERTVGCLIVTAPGEKHDFVSRFFAPACGIPEDPVTGAAHCTLTPFWASRLGKNRMRARQVSARGGELLCEQRAERVRLSGRAVLYLEGFIRV